MPDTPALDRFAVESTLSQAFACVAVNLLAATNGDIPVAARALRGLADIMERDGATLLPLVKAQRAAAARMAAGRGAGSDERGDFQDC